MHTKVNAIREKQKALARLQAKSNQALDVVTATINKLTVVNDKIDNTISEISDLQGQLQTMQNDLSSTKERNKRVVERFKCLIEA